MSETYNLYNLEAPFQKYLLAGNQKPISIKNYLSDVRHFFGWLISTGEETSPLQGSINHKTISEYKSYLESNEIPHKTINRRLSTIRKFCSFCISQGWMKENPAKRISNVLPSRASLSETKESRGTRKLILDNKASESPEPSSSRLAGSSRLITFLRSNFSLDSLLRGNDKQSGDDKGGGNDKKPTTDSTDSTDLTDLTKFGFQQYVAFLIILIFVSVMGAGIYNQFFVKNQASLAYPTALTKAGRILSFQGRLTDTLSNPITTATNVVFQLYSVSSGGTALYATGTCSTTPDQDGIFSTLIGSDCGSEITASVFTENANVYLGVTVGGDAEMTPRQQIANVGYAINSETLQGLPPGTGTSVIPYINVDGNLLISASAPGIRSTSASTDFTLSSAKATVIQSAGTGDIVLQATESGSLKFRTGGSTDTENRLVIDSTGLDITGNLQFSGALMPNSLAGSSGQFLISSGAGVAPAWTSTVPATSIPFSGITTGTNTSATMTVGTGATLTYSGSGVINATQLLGATWVAPGTIGSTTPNTGAFTTLTSSGASTIGTGASTTNTFGAGASSVNTIGSVTTPGALTLHGATTLNNTFTVSGSNLTSLGGNLTVTGTAWTATPTISGLITATSGLTSTGTLTANGSLDANGVVTLGDNGDNITIDSNVWDITAAGAISGVTTIGMSGVLTNSSTATNAIALTGVGAGITFSGATGVNQIITAAGIDLALMPGTTGNVGIGTTSPGTLLTLRSSTPTAEDAIIRLQTAAGNITTNTTIGDVEFYVQDASTGGTGTFARMRAVSEGLFDGATNTDVGMSLWTTFNGTIAERVRIDNAGNVGIGTTAPSGKLDVIDTSNTAASLSLTNNTATTIGVGINTLGVLDLQSTSLTTGNFLNIEVNALTSGHGLNLTSTSTGLTGDLANFTASGSNAAVTGNVLSVGLTGALSTGTALNVTTAGASGFALRVNDDGTYTDTTPFVVDYAGNVGIGTTAPGYALQVTGQSAGTGNIAADYLIDLGSTGYGIDPGGTNNAYLGSGYSLKITGGALLAYDSGNVGIGATSPAGKLDITDTSNTAASLSLTNNTATTIGAGINTLGVLDLQSTSLTTGNLLNLEVNALTSGKGLNLSSTSTGLTTGSLLNVTASGNPGATWTGNLGLFEYITSTDVDIDGSALKVGITGAGAGDGTALNVTTAQTGTSAYALRVNDDGTYTDSTPFVVDYAGNVGIGTTAPAFKLDVAGSIGPSTDISYDLGDYNNRFKNAYIGTLDESLFTEAGENLIKNPDRYNGGVGGWATATNYSEAVVIGPQGTEVRAITNSTTGSGTGLYTDYLPIDPKKAYLLEYWIKEDDISVTAGNNYLGREEYTSAKADNDQGNGPYIWSGQNPPAANTWYHVYAIIPPHDAGTENNHTATNSTLTPGTEYKIYSSFTAYMKVKIFLNYLGSTSSQVWVTNVALRPLSSGGVDSILATPGDASTSGNLQFVTGKAERMTIDSSGNVGIGTTAPASKLSVGGDGNASFAIYGTGASIGIRGESTNGYGVYGLDGGNGYGVYGHNQGTNGYGVYANGQGTGSYGIYATASTGIGGYFTSSSGYALITGTGSVGIGTTAPGYKLEVKGGTVRFENDLFVSGGSGNAGATSVSLALGDIDTGFHWISDGNFELRNNGGSTMRFTSTGNVGIGTTGPATTLEIKHPTTDTALRISTVTDGQARLEFAEVGSTGWSIGQRGSDDNFYINNGLGGLTSATKLFINTGGNVGIGTTTPGHLLNIVGTNNTTAVGIDIGSNASFDFAANSTSGYSTTFNMDDTGLKIGHNSSGRDIEFQTNSTTYVTLTGTGNVGIGVSPTKGKVEVAQTNAANDEAIYIDTEETTTTQAVFSIESDTTNGSGADTLKFKITADGSVYSDSGTYTSPADLAEMYYFASEVEPADIVEVVRYETDDHQISFAVQKSVDSSNNQVIGIISTEPGPIIGYDWNNPEKIAKQKPVALSGRVPVKISPSSAAINIGDPITSSVDPGRGMKATQAGRIVGNSLESWDPINPADKIMVFVNNTYYDPGIYLTDSGDLEIINDSQTPYVYDGNPDIQYQISNIKYQNYILNIKNELVNRIGAFSELVAANLKAGLIEAENAIVNNTLIAKNIISNKIDVSEKISSPIVETDKVVTNEIKPQNGDLTIDLSSPVIPAKAGIQDVLDPLFQGDDNGVEKGGLARLIIKGLEGKSAVVIDAAGNASFSGQIIADSLTINNDATIAGTLVAKEVQSGNINDLTKTVFDQRQSLTDQSTSINDIQKLLADIKNQPIPDPNYYQNLIVTGQSNLYNVSVSNSLLVGTTLIDQNSIISLASELKLSALSTINLFDGAVIIAKDGKITTRGEIIAEGGIRTNEIKSLTDDGQVSIKNLTINNLTIDKISTNSAVIAAADNFAQNGIFAPAIEAATASAGLGILPENSNEVVIYNSLITPDSLIYLTPTSPSPTNTQLTVVKKESGEKPYFKVAIDNAINKDIKFNWLIIN